MTSEKIKAGADARYPLNGLLTLPDGAAGPVPAVVMVHGSGPSDMDERVMKLTPFKDLATGLANRGVASLRYDKRTFAYRKELSKTDLTVREETVDDALAAVELLKNDPRIDRERVFLLGHSMGAMLAPRIDAEGADVKGLILMAGTPYRLEEVVIKQLARSGGNSVLGRVVKLESRIFSKKFDGLYQMSDEEAKKKRFAGNLTLYYFKEMGQKTASDYLSDSEKPVLILQGGKDFQVLAQDDFKAFREQLALRRNTDFRLYPKLDHCFVNAVTDDILRAKKEYGLERHIGGEVIGDIADFILRQTDGGADNAG